MKILGIDPGMAIVGYGLIEYSNNNISLLNSGSIQTDKTKTDSQRLLEIYNDLSHLIKKLPTNYHLVYSGSGMLYDTIIHSAKL